MMTLFFHIFICIILIIFQTTVFPGIRIFNEFYDLLAPFVIYLGVFRPTREGFPMVLILGFTMDGISGSPLGLYITTYFWLFIGVQWVIQFLHVGNFLILSIVVACGIALESIIHFSIIAIQTSISEIPHFAIITGVRQILWAVFTGPLLLYLFLFLQKKMSAWYGGFLSD
ncbi:MAG: hypothetical protein HKM93_05225 [Desulfobacteraceae bacterium]|nr:hypothetical protein [Desulfobacteraceae bacterium]